MSKAHEWKENRALSTIQITFADLIGLGRIHEHAGKFTFF